MTTESHAYAYGPDLARARTCVGPQSASTGSGHESLKHRGTVPDEERERLAASFGAELVRLRNEVGFSQGRLGGLAGLRGDHVGRLERGQRRPSVGAILALTRILVPVDGRESVQERLAALAGTSLREGAARKKQAADNKNRRLALGSARRTSAQMQQTIRAKEARGELVAGDFRRLADKMAAEVDRLRADQRPEGATITGRAPSVGRSRRQDRPRSRSMKDIEAWLDSSQED
jgi:transcriptional regulator with XRE-family HTH domain